MIFDIHTHAFPEKIAKKAMESLSHRSGGLLPFTDGTIDGLSAFMKSEGVSAFAVQNIATNPAQMKKVNDLVIISTML